MKEKDTSHWEIINISQESHTPQKVEVMEMIIQKIMWEGPELSTEQIDSIIQQREKAMDYTHADKKRISYDQKYMFTIVTISFLILAGLVSYKQPEYLGEIVSLFIGWLGGYGLWHVRK